MPARAPLPIESWGTFPPDLSTKGEGEWAVGGRLPRGPGSMASPTLCVPGDGRYLLVGLLANHFRT